MRRITWLALCIVALATATAAHADWNWHGDDDHDFHGRMRPEEDLGTIYLSGTHNDFLNLHGGSFCDENERVVALNIKNESTYPAILNSVTLT